MATSEIVEPPAQPECPICHEYITYEHSLTAVFIQVYAPRMGRYVHCGPFHGECGKIFNERMRAQNVEVRR